MSGADTFEKQSISRLLLRFTLATLAGLIFNALYTLSDALILSYGAGKSAVAAVGLAMPFTLLQGGISTALGSGAATLVSPAVGRKDYAEGGKIAITAMVTFWAAALAITALGLAFRTPLLYAFGATEELFVDARAYLTVLLVGNLFSTGFSAIIRAEGNLKYGVLIWVIPITLNIVLDVLFVFVLKWGVAGSAWATVACQFTSFCMSLLFFTRFSVLRFKGVKPSANALKRILLAGVPSLVQNGALSLLLALLNRLIGRAGGTELLTAFSYAFRLVSFAVLPMTALSLALMPIVGYFSGAAKDTKKVERYATVAGFVLGTVLAVVVAIGAKLWLRILTADLATIESAAKLVHVLACGVPFLAIPTLWGASRQAQGKLLRALVLYVLPTLGVAAVAPWCARLWGVGGAIWGFVGGTILATVVAIPVAFVRKKR